MKINESLRIVQDSGCKLRKYNEYFKLKYTKNLVLVLN
jgi:hypothetical protein